MLGLARLVVFAFVIANAVPLTLDMSKPLSAKKYWRRTCHGGSVLVGRVLVSSLLLFQEMAPIVVLISNNHARKKDMLKINKLKKELKVAGAGCKVFQQ